MTFAIKFEKVGKFLTSPKAIKSFVGKAQEDLMEHLQGSLKTHQRYSQRLDRELLNSGIFKRFGYKSKINKNNKAIKAIGEQISGLGGKKALPESLKPLKAPMGDRAKNMGYGLLGAGIFTGAGYGVMKDNSKRIKY